jgi:undecaprenyl-diphosphatase
MAHAILQFVATRDHALMRRVHRWSAPKWIRLWMIAATRSGDGWIWYGLAVIVFLFGGESRYLAIASATSAAAVGVGVFIALKKLTGRRRPCHIEPHCWSTLLPPDQFSFPSGHTITAFAIAVPVMLYYPPARWGLLFCAFSIALSRIVLGMHFLSDVVAGAILGMGLGYTSYLLFNL